MTEQKTMSFDADVKQLLELMVHSLYTHKEIFLRELVANASDALDKIRILSLTDKDILGEDRDLEIWLETDEDHKTLTVRDNGIGMTYDEVVENIGTIAKSSSEQFVSFLKQSQKDDADLNLIGQFGVGFYSAFMVADKVTLLTKSPKSDLGVRWESTGDGTYQIEEIEKGDRGTTVFLELKDIKPDSDLADEDFLNQYTLQKHIQNHCNFINYPIRMKWVTDEPERDEAGEIIEGKTNIVVEDAQLNSIQPLWEKDKKEIAKDQYVQFYSQQFHDWNEPSEILHLKGEGTVEFTALLFIPSQAPYNLYSGDFEKGLQLYCKHVLVMNNCGELLPDYLRFLRGIVDSPDLPLNVSREMLQQNRHLKVIQNFLEKRVIDAFQSFLEVDREKYEALWQEFGKAIKGGIYMEYQNTEKLQDLLLFETSGATNGKTTLKEYVTRMPDSQKEIYYVTGDSRDMVERLPQMERVKDKGIEILYFLDKVDEFLTQHLREYEGRKLRSVTQGDLPLEDEEEVEAEEAEEKGGMYKDLLVFMKSTLIDKVEDVRLSKRLSSSPVCLVASENGHSLNMERLMREANQPIFRAQRILEVNPDHDVIRTINRLLKEKSDESKVSDYCRLLYDQAALIENDEIDDPIRLTSIVSQLLVDAYR